MTARTPLLVTGSAIAAVAALAFFVASQETSYVPPEPPERQRPQEAAPTPPTTPIPTYEEQTFVPLLDAETSGAESLTVHGAAPAAFAKHEVLFATKTGFDVTVSAGGMSGTARTLFTYQEHATANDDGNAWSSRLPSATLSPDGKFIAYADVNGLHVHDRATRTISTLVTRSDASEDVREVAGTTWRGRSGEMEAFSIVSPVWSPAGEKIFVDTAAYEGGGVAIVSYPDGALTRLPIMVGNGRTVWHSGGEFVLQPNRAYDHRGLFIHELRSGSDVSLTELADVMDVYAWTAKFSPDASRVAFVFDGKTEIDGDRKNILGTVGTDGGGFVIWDAGAISDVLFSPGGDLTYYAKGGLLAAIDMKTSALAITALLPQDYQSWEGMRWMGEYLALTGVRAAAGGLEKQAFLVDVEAKTAYRIGPVIPPTAKSAVLGIVPAVAR